MSCPQLFRLVVEIGEAAAFWVGEIVISDVYPALSKSELPLMFTFCAIQLGFLSMHLEQKLSISGYFNCRLPFLRIESLGRKADEGKKQGTNSGNCHQICCLNALMWCVDVTDPRVVEPRGHC